MIKKENKRESWKIKTPIRKPPRLDGKQMKRGIKNIRKKLVKNK